MNNRGSEHNISLLSNADGGNVFQSVEFAEIKRSQGWEPLYRSVGDTAVTILEKQVFGIGKLWYIPKGPGVNSTTELQQIYEDLTKLAKDSGVFMAKIEPEIVKTEETLNDISNLGLVKVRPIQPNFSTVLIDTSPSLDDILKNLNQKGRHAIRRAERDGVKIKRMPATTENCQTMYELLAETAAGSFGIRKFEYYKEFWQKFEAANMGQLFFAYVEGKVVAGAYALIFGTKSTYKDGASVRERTVYGASHLLQWEVIKWAKENGATVHDLCGAPPSDQIKNPNHPHYGIGRFKTSFNKTVTDYVGAYDIVVKPFSYRIWSNIGERLTVRLHRALHKENYY